MAKTPHVSQGWSQATAALVALAKKGEAAAQKEAAVKADVGYSWTVYTNTLGGTLPDALKAARASAARMIQVVR